MDTVVEFGHALYYPHIEFNSRKWLRTSALYHDIIGRIVPQNFHLPYDNSEEAQLLREDMWALENAKTRGLSRASLRAPSREQSPISSMSWRWPTRMPSAGLSFSRCCLTSTSRT